ncbi:MAG: exopolysaccharide biosynthesis protein [Tepidisphaerales bacterium]
MNTTDRSVPAAADVDQTHDRATPAADVETTLEQDIQKLATLAEAGPVTFGQLVDTLGDRASTSLLVILALAFLVVPVPGVSTASSVVFFLLAFTSLTGRRPWLPAFVRRRAISQPYAQRMFASAGRIARWLGRYVKPRLTFLVHGVFRWLAGLSMALAIIAFALPIPIPFNNSPPALCILLLGLGLLNRDGLMLLLGHLANLILWVLLLMAGTFLYDLVRRALEWLGVFGG